MSGDTHGSVLVVDDEPGVRELLTRWLESRGLSVTSASSADEAMRHLIAAPPAVALCDVRMPGHDGLWLAARIREEWPESAVIIATGMQEAGPVIHSLRQGVVDYLAKPFGRERLQEAVECGLEWHRNAWDARRWRETLDQETELRRARLADAMSALRIDSDHALDAMLSMVTLSDREAYAHAHRVAALATKLGVALGIERGELDTLTRAALLHDVGKLAMPDAIVRKPAPLTGEEQALIRQHPAIGSALVASVPFLAAAAPLIREAHEWTSARVAGGGTDQDVDDARRLSGAILAVADAFDTMTHPRVFRHPRAPAEALVELERCKGTQFDPRVVDALLDLAR